MKKLLFSTLSVFLLFVACSKEEQAPPPPPTPTYTLSFSAEAGGSVSSEGGTYTQGSKITVTATPDAQYLFKEWSDGSTTNPRDITVTSNLTLSATFVKKTYPLAVTIEGEGTVQEEVIIQGSTSETEYNAGTTVRLTATPNEGWVFAGWSGDVESEELEIEVPIEKGIAVSALFKRDSFELNITIEGEGTVKEEVIVQPAQYDYETVVRLTAIPAEGYVFSGWADGLDSSENPIEVEVGSDQLIKAVFVESSTKFMLQMRNESGLGYVVNLATEDHLAFEELPVNSEISFEARPITGYKFSKWTGTLESTENPVTLKMTETKIIVPVFERDPNSTVNLVANRVQIPLSEKRLFSYRFTPNGMKVLNIQDETFVVSQGSNWTPGTELPAAYQLKLTEEGKWIFEKEFEEARFQGIRNDELVGNTLLFTDHDEHREDPIWRGHLWVADVTSKDIEWYKVTTEDEQSYFHGGGLGDVNGDGLLDVVGTAYDYKQLINDPNFFSVSYQTSGPMIWRQTSPGMFEMDTSFFPPQDLRMGHAAVQLDDLDNDGVPELITGPYLITDDFTLSQSEIRENSSTFSIYKQDSSKEYKKIYKSKSPNPFYGDNPDMGLTRVDCYDLNGDNYKDLILSREGSLNESGALGATIEIWINNQDLTFKETYVFDLSYDLSAIAVIHDLDDDGDLDFVAKTSDPMFVRRSPQQPWDAQIDLAKLIFLNNGDGTFTNSPISIPLEGLGNFEAYPYINTSGKLAFFMSHSFETGCADCGGFYGTTYDWMNVIVEEY